MTNENKEDLPKPILIEDLGMMYPTENSKYKTRYGLYKCGFCGTEFRAQVQHINSGNIKSCGCYRIKKVIERNTKHGFGYTRLYSIWTNMNMRIYNPQYKQYNDYGGRGISICDEWKNDFMSFYNWAMSNGYSEGLSLDRIDNDGNYEPNNCRWVTRTIQSRNKRIQKNNKTGYRGVHFRKDNNNFRVLLSVNKKRIYLGLYPTAVEGAIAYNNYIIENNLEGFILNEIPQEYLEKETTNEKIN